jgi:hypothetical protein
MDDMKVVVQQIRDPKPTQCSTSDFVNIGRNPPSDGEVENNQGSSSRGTTPMDTKEDPPNPLQNSEMQDTTPNMS